MKAYTGISLPVIKLNVSSPSGDDNNFLCIKCLITLVDHVIVDDVTNREPVRVNDRNYYVPERN
jgi:hypothetical protein